MKDCLAVELGFIKYLAKNNFVHPINDGTKNTRPFLEPDVRRLIINPILKCLGWKFSSADIELDEDFYVYSGPAIECVLKYGRVNYAYIHKGKFKIFIEAKKCIESLDKHIEQIGCYIESVPNIDLIVLTNAHEWRFFSPYTKPSYLNFLTQKINENSDEEISRNLIDLLSIKNIISSKTYQIVQNHIKNSNIKKRKDLAL